MNRWGILLLVFGIILSCTGLAAAQPQGAALAERGIPPGWKAERVETPPTFSNMGPHSLARGPDGVMRLAYGGDHLYYTYMTDFIWAPREVVDAEWGVGQATSLAVDSNNKAHISYYDAAMGGLRYATNKSGTWQITILDPSGVGPSTALALDSSDRPHIVYQRSLTSLGYQYQLADGSWSGDQGIVLSPGGTGVSAAMGSDNHLHVSWYSNTGSNPCINYATKNELGVWSYPNEAYCPALTNLVKSTALALDSHNRPHILFVISNVIYQWVEGASGWLDPAVITSSLDDAPYFSIAIDSQDQVNIAYKKPGGLAYARQDTDGAWSFNYGYISENPGAGDYVSLALDLANLPMATYLREDHTYNSKKLAGPTWPFGETMIDSIGRGVGNCSALTTASDGTAYLSYFADYNFSTEIKIARRVGGAWDLSMPPVVISGSPNCQHTMVLNYDTEAPAIAYTNQAGELWYAQWMCAVSPDPPHSCHYFWMLMKIADDVFVPESVAIAHNSTYDLLFSFNRNGKLTLATFDHNHIELEVDEVEDLAISGQTSLAVDAANHVHIAYFHSNQTLYYAEKNGDAWKIEQVDSTNSGPYVSLKLNNQGWPRIAYTGDLSGLRFIAKSPIPAPPYFAWSAVEVIQPSILIYSPSLGIDSQGHFYISYSTGINGWLYLALKSTNNWQNQKIDASRSSGAGGSLSISPLNNRPSISYYDGLNQDIKYVYEQYASLIPVLTK